MSWKKRHGASDHRGPKLRQASLPKICGRRLAEFGSSASASTRYSRRTNSPAGIGQSGRDGSTLDHIARFRGSRQLIGGRQPTDGGTSRAVRNPLGYSTIDHRTGVELNERWSRRRRSIIQPLIVHPLHGYMGACAACEDWKNLTCCTQSRSHPIWSPIDALARKCHYSPRSDT